MFAKREQITGNYYLVENENGTFDISYKVGDGYIGRNPSEGQVIGYAVKNTILVMKVQPYKGESFYYAIDMKKDIDIAKQVEYEMAIVSVKEFNHSWLAKLNLAFQDVK